MLITNLKTTPYPNRSHGLLVFALAAAWVHRSSDANDLPPSGREWNFREPLSSVTRYTRSRLGNDSGSRPPGEIVWYRVINHEGSVQKRSRHRVQMPGRRRTRKPLRTTDIPSHRASEASAGRLMIESDCSEQPHTLSRHLPDWKICESELLPAQLNYRNTSREIPGNSQLRLRKVRARMIQSGRRWSLTNYTRRTPSDSPNSLPTGRFHPNPEGQSYRV